MLLLTVWTFLVMLVTSSNIPTCDNNGLAYVTEFETLCYWFNFNNKWAANANSVCKQSGGALAYIPNQEAFNVVRLLGDISRLTAENVWFYIGYLDYWDNRSVVSYNAPTSTVQHWGAWAPGQPGDHWNEECVMVATEDYTWHDIRCTAWLKSLCFKVIYDQDTLSSNVVCDNNGLAYVTESDKLCYWYNLQTQEVETSENSCRSQGGELAYIPNQEAFDVVLALRDIMRLTNYNNWFFIGYLDIWNNGSLIDRGRSLVQNWANWRSTEPNEENEECVAIGYPDYKWMDVPCNLWIGSICYNRIYIQEETTSLKPEVTSSLVPFDSTTEVSTTVSTIQISTDKKTEATSSTLAPVESTTETSTSNPAEQTSTDTRTEVTSSTSAPVESTTAESTVHTSTHTTLCHCACFPAVSLVELQNKILELKTRLAVNRSSLSSTRRKITCATDDRTSSVRIGFVGVVLLSVIFGMFPILDSLKLLEFIKHI